jgi:RNA polymerase sigma-19 factor, ECF subfamily
MNDLPDRNEGSLKWFNQVIHKYYPCLCDFACVITHSREFSKEIVDDVFIKIWDRREEVSHIENLASYLYKAVKNTSFNYLEKKNRHHFVSFDNLPEISLPSELRTPEEDIISKEIYRDISQVINSLPEKCRLIFKLAKEDNLKYKEIADLLTLSEKTVENQISIALKKIAECLKKRNILSGKIKNRLSGLLSVFF